MEATDLKYGPWFPHRRVPVPAGFDTGTIPVQKKLRFVLPQDVAGTVTIIKGEMYSIEIDSANFPSDLKY
jgi:hypothetical protein